MVKNRKAASELLDSPSIALELKKIEDALLDERKARKKLLKQPAEEEQEEDEAEEEDAEEPQEEVKMKHMLIKEGEAPSLPVDKTKGEKAW